jgi:hypothetical protein
MPLHLIERFCVLCQVPIDWLVTGRETRRSRVDSFTHFCFTLRLKFCSIEDQAIFSSRLRKKGIRAKHSSFVGRAVAKIATEQFTFAERLTLDQLTALNTVRVDSAFSVFCFCSLASLFSVL